MFNLLFVGGLVELLLSLKKIQGKIWEFFWPGVIITIGLMFLFHPQHGTPQEMAYAIPYHTALGTVLLITGILKALQIIWYQKYKLLIFGWIVFLFITSILLLIYKEPEGVYQQDTSTQQQMIYEHGN